MTVLPRPMGAPPRVPPTVRYVELAPDERAVILTLAAESSATTTALATTLRREVPALQDQLDQLMAGGFLERAGERWSVSEEVQARVLRDLDHTVGARLVAPCAGRLRPSPLTEGERVLASLCRELCWPHPVSTRVPLRHVLDVQV